MLTGQAGGATAVGVAEATGASAAASGAGALSAGRVANRAGRARRAAGGAITGRLVRLALAGGLIAAVIRSRITDGGILRAVGGLTAEAVQACLTAGAIGVTDTLDAASGDAVRRAAAAVLLGRLRGAARLARRYALAIGIAALVAGAHRIAGALDTGAEVAVEDLAVGARAGVGAANRATAVLLTGSGGRIARLTLGAAVRRAVGDARGAFAVLTRCTGRITSGSRVVLALTRIGIAGLAGPAASGRAVAGVRDAHIASVAGLALTTFGGIEALAGFARTAVEVAELTTVTLGARGAVAAATIGLALAGQVADLAFGTVFVTVTRTGRSLVHAQAFVADLHVGTLVAKVALSLSARSLAGILRRGAYLAGLDAEFTCRLDTLVGLGTHRSKTTVIVERTGLSPCARRIICTATSKCHQCNQTHPDEHE